MTCARCHNPSIREVCDSCIRFALEPTQRAYLEGRIGAERLLECIALRRTSVKDLKGARHTTARRFR